MKTEAAQAEAGKVSDRLPPLYVDLDGTLSTSDTLWEGMAMAVREKTASLPGLVLAGLRGGRPGLKAAVARIVPDAAAKTPINDEVLRFSLAQRDRRDVILATAAGRGVAEAVAERTGGFDAVLASDHVTNLKGAKKLTAIQADAEARTGSKDFDYIGDSPADRPIWKAAGRAHVVAPSREAALDLAAGTPLAEYLPSPKGGLRDAVKAMRPHQWVKNVLVFVPLVLSHQLFDPGLFLATLCAFFAMSICASATYIWNDVLDLPADRQHRSKRNRPIAAGRLPISRAMGLSVLLLALASLIALLVNGWLLLIALYGYVALTLAYSLLFKRKLLVDAIVLAGLFGYRVLLGSAATGILISDWLIAFSVFFFFGLALAKRYVEIDASDAPSSERLAGRGYRPSDREVILNIGIASSFVAIIILSLYTTSPDVQALYRFPKLLWGVAVALIYWSGRVWVLAHRRELNDDPIVFAVKDRISYVCAAGCAVFLLAAGPI